MGTMIANLTKLTLLAGLVIALSIALLFAYMALDHDPQGSYSSDPAHLWGLVLISFSFVFAPFGVLAIIIELIARLLRRKDEQV
jgi:hypothetical protein